jgi:two-component system sensor histidine kinase VicK
VSNRSQQDQKTLSLTLDAPKNLPRVIGDAERLRQVLENLVENAYNYTPENGAIRVALRALKGGEVQVDVVDNGVGIATEDQQRAFERFYRGENPLVLATPGTGLGLAIVQQIVQMHGGRVWLTSSGTPGQGTTASFTLPAVQRA